MTREEVIEKIMIINRNSDLSFQRERGYAEAYVKGLEAVGLLKFEEAPGPDCRDMIIASTQFPRDPVTVKVYKAIEALENAGYKVDRR